MRTFIQYIKQYGFLILIAALLSSCFKYDEIEITNIKSVKLLELSDKGLIVESEIEIKNPNSFEVSVVDSEFQVYIKNKKIAKSSIDGKVTIPKKSHEYHTIILKSDYSDLASGALGNMLMLTLGSDEIDFKVEGYVTGKAFFIKKKVQVSHSDKVPLKIY